MITGFMKRFVRNIMNVNNAQFICRVCDNLFTTKELDAKQVAEIIIKQKAKCPDCGNEKCEVWVMEEV